MKLRAIIALSSAALLTLVFALVSGAGPPPCGSDGDSDGVCDDYTDNCLGLANAGQRDDDEDGYGNLCDNDTSQDCIVGGPDIAGVFGRVLDGSPWTPKNAGAYDVNEDGVVGGPDIAQVFGDVLDTPGPSAMNCADCSATPTAGLGLGVCPAGSLP